MCPWRCERRGARRGGSQPGQAAGGRRASDCRAANSVGCKQKQHGMCFPVKCEAMGTWTLAPPLGTVRLVPRPGPSLAEPCAPARPLNASHGDAASIGGGHAAVPVGPRQVRPCCWAGAAAQFWRAPDPPFEQRASLIGESGPDRRHAHCPVPSRRRLQSILRAMASALK